MFSWESTEVEHNFLDDPELLETPFHDRLNPSARIVQKKSKSGLFDQNPHALSACLWYLHHVIRRHVDGIPLRLEELHVDVSENGRQSNVQLRMGKIDAQTAARAFAEADEIARERLLGTASLGVAEPAIRVECVAARKISLVVVLVVACQADRDARQDGVRAVCDG